MLSFTKAFLALIPATVALINPNGVGKLPALGWNSWNAFECGISEAKILTAAQQMVSLGLKDAGYEYVNIDDCWQDKTGRDSNGRLVANATTFPDGIDGLANKIHAMGLKLGIYSSAGTETCAGYPASIGKEETDAETWAAWGIDYLKYDNCNVPENLTDWCYSCNLDAPTGPNGTCTGWKPVLCPSGYNYSQSNTAKRMCEWGTANVQSWGNATGNSWRATDDILPTWTSILSILNQNSFYMNNVNFWGHSDPDMLEVGNGDLTPEETRSHFAFWAAMKAPLLIGTDLTKISPENLALLKNPTLLAFNQDPVYGGPAQPYKWGTNPDWTFNASYPAEYWAGKYSNGTLVLVLNTNDAPQTKTIDFAEVPGLQAGGSYEVTDVWSGASQACITGSMDVVIGAHDTAVYTVGRPCKAPKKDGGIFGSKFATESVFLSRWFG